MSPQVTSRDHLIKQSCNFSDRNPHYKFHGHTLCETVSVTLKTTINFYDMTTLLYHVIKEKFE